MIVKNQVLERTSKKPIVYDAFFKDKKSMPLVIFCHGYKGFKDWGAWDLVAESFMKCHMFFVKFNFSHNGGTVSNPIDFPDLEAFAENNYTKELDDLNDVLNFFLSNNFEHNDKINHERVVLIGHSRGGGISIIKASEDPRINTLITWASVSEFGRRTATTNLEQWKKDGVKYVMNGRTKQMMPHNYQFHLDYMSNKERFDIGKAAQNICIPFLIVHAKGDPTVLFEEAEALHSYNKDSTLFFIEDSNHVFDAKHPWKDAQLPKSLETILDKSISFIG